MNTNDVNHIFWKRLWGSISGSSKLAFFSAFLAGFVTHLYLLTNLLLNHDSVLFIHTANDVTESGRWALRWFSNLSGYYQMPVVIGVLSIFALALCAAFTVSFLEMKDPVGITLTSGLLVAFPTVACIFSYLFTADAYFLALCINAIGIWLTKKFRWGWLPCVLLLTLGLGVYQAFFCYAISLFLIDCILRLYSDEDSRKICRQGLKYILILIVSLVFYMIAVKYFQFSRHIEMTAYQGLNELGTISPAEYLKQIPAAVRSFWDLLWNPPYFSAFLQKIQRTVCVLLPVQFLLLWYLKRLYRNWFKTFLLLVGFLLLPVAMNLISVIMLHGSVTMLVLYPLALFTVLFLKLSEMLFVEIQSSHIRIPVKLVPMILSLVLFWGNVCVCNEAYLRLQIRYENTYSVSTRIVDRIESLEGFSFEMPVAFAGVLNGGNYGNTVPGLAQHTDLMACTNNTIIYYNPYLFIRDYVGSLYQYPDKETLDHVADSGILKEMPIYPADDSIQIYDGIVVVKLSEGDIWR